MKSGEALATALSNFSIAQERLRVTNPDELRKQDLDLARSDRELSRDIAVALQDFNVEAAEEARIVASIPEAYPSYLEVRDRLLAARARGASGDSLDPAFDGAFESLRVALKS